MSYKKILLYTVAHFAVDFFSIFMVVGVLLGTKVGIVDRGNVIILYNLVAFAGQLPIGMIADLFNNKTYTAMIGCILVGISCFLIFISPWLACFIVAVGNGIFHIGAGSDILKYTMPKAGASGVFVSGGAFGVWLACKVSGQLFMLLSPVVMAIFVFLIFKTGEKFEKEEKINVKYIKPKAVTVILVSSFMLTIVIRSLLGMVMNFTWKAEPLLSFLFVLAVTFGKALGGVSGDRFGYIKTAVISLLLSFVCFIFSFDYWQAGIVGVLCFNMTMPLTLTAISDVSERKYGFAFGLTTFALAIGFIPMVFGGQNLFGLPLLLWGVSASLILMVIGYVLKAKGVKE